jgi:hypothetical protein
MKMKFVLTSVKLRASSVSLRVIIQAITQRDTEEVRSFTEVFLVNITRYIN